MNEAQRRDQFLSLVRNRMDPALRGADYDRCFNSVRAERPDLLDNRAAPMLAIANSFDPSQPRDEDGKWTTSGGATVSTRALGRERRIDTVEDSEWSWAPGFSPDDDGFTTHKATGDRAINVYGKIKRSKDRGATYAGDLDEAETTRYRAFHAQVREANKTLSERNLSAIKAANPEPPRRYPKDEAKAREWDRKMNEGGEGYNPYR